MNDPKLYAEFNSIKRDDVLLFLHNYFNCQKWNTKRGLKILDVGSADGSLTMNVIVPYIGKSFGELIGIDICEEMVQYANKYYKNSNVKFIQFDIASPSIARNFENRFDIIFSLYCLHLVPNQRKALENIFKMLQPGGDVLISIMNRGAVFESYAKLATNSKWSVYMEDYQNFISPYSNDQYPEDTITKIMREVGFEVHQCKSETAECNFKSKDHLKGMKSVCAFISRIPEKDVDQYIEDFVDGIIDSDTVQTYKSEDGYEKFIMKYELLIVSASKPENMR